MPQPGARVCVCNGCRRTPAEGQSICGRCAKHVPPEIWLAIHDHVDAYQQARGDLRDFISWAWGQMHMLAAYEATTRRYLKRQGLDPDLPPEGHWFILPDGRLGRNVRRA